MRSLEQIKAVTALTDKEDSELRRFNALPDDAVGLDGVSKASCFINGYDTANEIGVTRENGFSYTEIGIACDRFALSTAKTFELI